MLGRLLWPERIPVSAEHRAVATSRISNAQATGLIDAAEARERQARVQVASTREELRPSVDGLPGTTPKGLIIARRVATGIWLGMSLIQFCVWMLVCLIGLHLVNPWWLWTAIGGGLIVAGLWWATESEYRMTPAIDGKGSEIS